MEQMAKLLILLALLSCAPISDHPKNVNEEYEIYSTIIDSIFSEPSTKLIVINDSTILDYYNGKNYINTKEYEIDSLGLLTFLLHGINAPSREEVYQDYIAKSTEKYKLDLEKIMFNIKTTALNRNDFTRFFDRGANNGWSYFYEKYPNSIGYLEFSRVSFNKIRDIALVYIENICGGLCGSGDYYLLEREKDKWKIKGRVNIWTS